MTTWKMINALNNATFTIAGSVSYIDDEGETHNFTLESANLRHIMRRYADWVLCDYDWVEHTSAYECLTTLWNAFISINAPRFGRMFRALDTEYNPLHNYDKDSVITTEHSGDITYNKGITQTNTIAEVTLTTTAPQTTTTNKVGSFDSTTLVDASQSVNSGGTGTNKTSGHTDTYANSGHDTDIFNNTDTITERTRGNIGVTQSADMALNEIRLRRNELTAIIVHEFMCENGYLCVDCEY